MNVRLSLSAGIAVAIAACSISTPASAAIDKLATYAQMRAIAAEQLASRGISAQQAHVAQLQQQFDALKDSMGGDDPTTMYEAGTASHSAKGLSNSPPTPPGLLPTTTSVSNNTPVPIPTGPGVVTSTILVAGAGPYLWDVDVSTALQHSFSADLDVTITSPAGTVVTLTTDNGGANDNVFDGTLWDDQANPAGQVPYTTNDGLVTDQVYVNLTPALTLVPEEALGAFRGEDPNGTWTITINDDLAGDGGSLNAWTLNLFTIAAAPTETTVTYSDAVVVAVPTGPGAVTSTITVAGAGTTLTAIDVLTGLQHTFSADLDVTLQSPMGTVVTLTSDNGGANDDVFAGTNWDDNANPAGQVPYVTNDGVVSDHTFVNLTAATPLVAEEALSAFLGEDPNGIWTLTVSDDLAGDGGSLNSWSMDITTGVGVTAPVFDYVPAPAGTVGFTGGGAIGSSATGTITVTVATAGVGTGAASTTTTTCTPPTAPFSGFGQSVTAEGTGAISGSPLSGSCTLGAALVTQTLTCSENQGGTPVVRTFELSCPAGTATPITSTPGSGSSIILPTQSSGGAPTISGIQFQNPGLVDVQVTCTAPIEPQFSVSPLVFNVPAAGNASTTITYSSPTAGTFTGLLICSAGNQQFRFDLSGTTSGVQIAIPAMDSSTRTLLLLAMLIAGVLAVGVYSRRS